jgi:transcriptional regulator with XRE-family HTH domain
MKSKYKNFKKKIKDNDLYSKDLMLLEFVSSINKLLEKNNLTQKKLAERLDKSEAYVSKVLSGNANLTVNTIVKFSKALGALPHLHVAEKNMFVEWVERSSSKSDYAIEYDDSKGFLIVVGKGHYESPWAIEQRPFSIVQDYKQREVVEVFERSSYEDVSDDGEQLNIPFENVIQFAAER